jgi:hypothetical protein
MARDGYKGYLTVCVFAGDDKSKLFVGFFFANAAVEMSLKTFFLCHFWAIFYQTSYARNLGMVLLSQGVVGPVACTIKVLGS